ncbi:MAG: pyridoxamine 5'-phosphate oxidase [Anaerolineae bacterium]|nr:pyridoxamine 5'-phosphate oxidase [Anaerolineae bacterium]
MISSDPALLARIAVFLSKHHVLNLAYADGPTVGACALWFAADEACTCYFLSSLTTRHGTALAHGGQIAFTVQKDEQDWRAIQGVQGRGWCEIVPDAGHVHAWAAYTARFPFVAQQFPDLQAALAKTQLWRMTPAWLRLIDNTKGFGHKDELTMANSE